MAPAIRKPKQQPEQLPLPLPKPSDPPIVQITGCAGHGWFSADLSPRAWARARADLAKVDPLFVQVVGSLA